MTLLEVDATQFMLELLAPARLARVVTELPGDLAAAMPVLQVVRAGGPNDRYVIDQPTFALHAYCATSPNGVKAANVLLYKAFTTLVAATGQVVTVDGGRATLVRVDSIGGPSPAPYENPNVRHAVSTIQARIRAV